MPFTIDKCELFRIKHSTLLEGETFLRNKHEIVFFFLIKFTFLEKKKKKKCGERNIFSIFFLRLISQHITY